MEVEAIGWDGCRDRSRWLEQSGLSEWSAESVGVVEVVEVGVAGAFNRSGWIGRGGRSGQSYPGSSYVDIISKLICINCVTHEQRLHFRISPLKDKRKGILANSL